MVFRFNNNHSASTTANLKTHIRNNNFKSDISSRKQFKELTLQNKQFLISIGLKLKRA